MKRSVNLTERNDTFISDLLARGRGDSRSALVNEALDLMREKILSSDYAKTLEEWHESGEATAWDVGQADGLNEVQTTEATSRAAG